MYRNISTARSLELGRVFAQRSGALPGGQLARPAVFAGNSDLPGADVGRLALAVRRRIAAGQYGEAARLAAQDTAQSPLRPVADAQEFSSGQIEPSAAAINSPNRLMDAVTRRLRSTGREPRVR